MPKTFEEAKADVLLDLSKRVPDNGAEAQWIRTQVAAANKMTSDTFPMAMDKPAEGNEFDAERAVATEIKKKMSGGKRHKKTRARKTRKGRKMTRRR